jgi:large subunit ribosomal protein L9
MDVILLKEVSNLGEAGIVIKVKDGYGRNYLIPKGLALQATAANKKAFEHEKKRLMQGLELEKKGVLELAKRLESLALTLEAAIGEQDKMYGSITAHHIQEALQVQGIKLDRRRILLEEPIRSLGEHAVSVKLHPEVVVLVKVSIVPKS